MTTSEINQAMDKNGVFIKSNERNGWYAISSQGINMITFPDKTFGTYTDEDFAKKLTQLIEFANNKKKQ